MTWLLTFVRSGGAWAQQAYLKASNTGAFDNFGSSVAISRDALVVGAVYEASSATGINENETDNSAAGSGAAYVFSFDAAAPMLASFTRQSPSASQTGADTLVFRAAFNEDVQNVDPSDFIVNSASTAAITAVDAVNAAVYDITVSGGDLAGFNGTVGINLSAVQDIQDLSGNNLPAGEPDLDETYTLVNTTPDPAALPDTGFPVGQHTRLPNRPADKAYTSSNLTLSIPALGIKTAIVGVPRTDTGWDVTWLAGSAGYLHGSAFPTWAGNTVITGHVWGADNQPGVFANLKNLQYGDRFSIHLYDHVYTYEIRSNRLVGVENTASVFRHETYDWVTLVTCETYNPDSGIYHYRRVVRAVLISVGQSLSPHPHARP